MRESSRLTLHVRCPGRGTQRSLAQRPGMGLGGRSWACPPSPCTGLEADIPAQEGPGTREAKVVPAAVPRPVRGMGNLDRQSRPLSTLHHSGLQVCGRSALRNECEHHSLVRTGTASLEDGLADERRRDMLGSYGSSPWSCSGTAWRETAPGALLSRVLSTRQE